MAFVLQKEERIISDCLDQGSKHGHWKDDTSAYVHRHIIFLRNISTLQKSWQIFGQKNGWTYLTSLHINNHEWSALVVSGIIQAPTPPTMVRIVLGLNRSWNNKRTIFEKRHWDQEKVQGVPLSGKGVNSPGCIAGKASSAWTPWDILSPPTMAQRLWLLHPETSWVNLQDMFPCSTCRYLFYDRCFSANP